MIARRMPLGLIWIVALAGCMSAGCAPADAPAHVVSKRLSLCSVALGGIQLQPRLGIDSESVVVTYEGMATELKVDPFLTYPGISALGAQVPDTQEVVRLAVRKGDQLLGYKLPGGRLVFVLAGHGALPEQQANARRLKDSLRVCGNLKAKVFGQPADRAESVQ